MALQDPGRLFQQEQWPIEVMPASLESLEVNWSKNMWEKGQGWSESCSSSLEVKSTALYSLMRSMPLEEPGMMMELEVIMRFRELCWKSSTS